MKEIIMTAEDINELLLKKEDELWNALAEAENLGEDTDEYKNAYTAWNTVYDLLLAIGYDDYDIELNSR